MATHPKYVSQSPLSVNKQIAQNMMFQKVTINHTVPITQKSASALPVGWKREEILRPDGLSSGKTVVFYVSPNGMKIRTQKELQNALGDKFDISSFDWRTGKFSSSLLKHRIPNSGDQNSVKSSFFRSITSSECKTEDIEYDWFQRNTTPNFPEPVIVLNHNDSNRSDKSPVKESLKQLFSERRLSDRYAVDHRDGETLIRSTLPPGIESAGVPGYNKSQLLQNLIVSLSSKHGPITGQERTVEQNPCAMLNQNQPYVKNFVITDEDIRKQYQRVKDIRDRLQAARKVYPEFLFDLSLSRWLQTAIKPSVSSFTIDASGTPSTLYIQFVHIVVGNRFVSVRRH
ncbi:methyl CpG binding domain protein 2 [Echinococcus multilocularis]|uniref:Methyl CpG binding domain protein 2 n=1 Tax=Echinococcus multilocularis TaxID=6211 RepID=A0A068YDI8_ECHMU|nr:methyl CpG binding domain protein 2 [Echinococcus multilocularis]